MSYYTIEEMIKEIDFQYCPRCSAPFQKQAVNLLVCSKCGLHFYINPKPTVTIILQNSKNEILLVVRKYDPKKGMLDLPGGFVNVKETLEAAMVRELQEELGVVIDMNNLTYLGSEEDEYEHGGVDGQTINIFYQSKIDDDVKITPADDVASYLFVSVQEIPYDQLAFAGMKSFLKKIFSK